MTTPIKKHAEVEQKHDELEEVEQVSKIPHGFPCAMYKQEGPNQLELTAHNVEEEKAMISRGYVNGHEFFAQKNKEVESKKKSA